MERNGHHYFRGQDHLAESEREHLQSAHGDLYTPEGRLDIVDGRIELASLDVAGFGYEGPIEMAHAEEVDA